MLLREFKMLKTNKSKSNQRLEEVPRERRRLPQSQLPRRLLPRRLLLVSPLMSERALIRLLNTLQTSHQAEKRPHKRVNLPQLLASHLQRKPQLVPRPRSQPTHLQVERNPPRPLIK